MLPITATEENLRARVKSRRTRRRRQRKKKKKRLRQRREKIQEWKNEQKAAKLFEIVAQKLKRDLGICYKEFGNDLIKKYVTLYAAFEEAAYDIETLRKDGFTGDWLKSFGAVAKSNISIPFVDIKGYINLTSWLPDGVKHIRNILTDAEESDYEDVEIKIKYIGAPQYMITVKAPDYKIAEEEMKKAVDKIKVSIKKFNGECEFHRKLEE